MRLSNLIENDLPMDKASRMARAKALGFTIPAFHGTAMKFNEFDLEKGKSSHMGGYAPHFANKKAEASGYAKEHGRGSKVLHCLLRIRQPLEINLNKYVSPEFYEKITGTKWTESGPPKSYWMIDDLRKQFGNYENSKKTWTMIYRHLISLGYDALHYTDMPPDHSASHYDKYVVFDPKNIRLIDATFDPAQSESADLMA